MTYRKRLREIALDQYGYVTTQDAVEAGIPAGELRKLVHRSGLTRIGRRLARFDDILPTEMDQFMEAILWVGPGAVLGADAVLALHDLAQANPKSIQVYTPNRVRREPRADITITRRAIPEEAVTEYFGIPSTTVKQALMDARGRIMPTRLEQAAREARVAGLIGATELVDLVKELQHV